MKFNLNLNDNDGQRKLCNQEDLFKIVERGREGERERGREGDYNFSIILGITNYNIN